MFLYIFVAGESVGLSCDYVVYFVFLRDVWIRTQRAAVASRCATNLATHLISYASQCMLKIHVLKQNVFTTYDLYVSLYVIPCPSYCCVIVLVSPLIILVPSMGIKQGMSMARYTQYTVYGIAH
jgi:hypothetical protein